MIIKIIQDNFDKELFNQKAKHPLQSWEWGEAREKMGIKVLRIAEYSNKQITNVYQLTFHKLPKLSYSIGYLPRSEFPSKHVLEFLYDYGEKHNVIFIKIEPYVPLSLRGSETTEAISENEIATSPSAPRDDIRIVKSPHPLFPEWTQILDLTKPEEELLKAMHSKTRYNIRLAQKKEVVVQEMSNEKGFEIFSKLYFDTCKRQQYHGHSPHYHKIIWESLRSNIAHICIAFYNDTPLAAYELFHFKDTFYYPYGGTSLEFRNVMAPNLLMWKAIRLGKKLGAKKFDMWGSLAPNYDQHHDWAGFTRFKEGYGGKFVQFVGSYDLVIAPFAYKIYNSVYKLRELYLRIKKNVS